MESDVKEPTLVSLYKRDNPDVSDIPNGKLAYVLWEKEYGTRTPETGRMPMGEFASYFGLTPTEFKDMVALGEKTGLIREESNWLRSSSMEEDLSEAFGLPYAEYYAPAIVGTARGATMGGGDEGLSYFMAGLDYVLGNTDNFSKTQKQYEKDFYRIYQTSAENFPVQDVVGQITGGILGPANAIGLPRKAQEFFAGGGRILRAAKRTLATMITGGAGAATYGYLDAEEGKRENRAIEDAKFGVIGGPLLHILLGSVGSRNLKRAWKKRINDNTIESYDEVRKAAYQDVDAIGLKATPSEYQDALLDIYINRIDKNRKRYPKEAIEEVERWLNKESTISDLDNIKKALSPLYNASVTKKNPSGDTAILDLMTGIDTLIEQTLQKGAKSGVDQKVLANARLAHSQYMKAKVVNDVFEQIATEGEAGLKGEVTRYRAAINNLLKNNNYSKWYTAEEKKVMQSFVKGDTLDKFAVAIAKTAPGGSNGLLNLLHIGGIFADPTLLALSASTLAGKKYATAAEKFRAKEIIKLLGEGKGYLAPPVRPYRGGSRGGFVTSATMDNEIGGFEGTGEF
jgi:hypothetical protein